jgi:hypothetical protein
MVLHQRVSIDVLHALLLHEGLVASAASAAVTTAAGGALDVAFER